MADSKTDLIFPDGSTGPGWESKTIDGVTCYFQTRTQAREGRKMMFGALDPSKGWLRGAAKPGETAPLSIRLDPVLTTEDPEPENNSESALISEPSRAILIEEESVPAPAVKGSTMAHEITQQDNVVLYKNPAWHGIGNVVPEMLSPMEAMAAAELDWEVKTVTPDWTVDGITRPSKTCQLALRMPREGKLDRSGKPEEIIELAKVGMDWAPIQNREMFALAEAGAGLGVKIESAGSVRQGRRVFALLRADSFVIGGNDQVYRYLLLAMGHDSELTLRAVPTSIRAACSNMLTMALRGNKYHSIRHIGDIQGRLLEMQRAIAHFKKTGADFEDAAKVLHSRKLTSAQLESFWKDAWLDLNGGKEAKTDNMAAKAKETLFAWQARLEIERMELGEQDVSLWLAMNAVTQYVQHRPAGRKTDDALKTADLRMNDNLMGVGNTLTSKVFERALALV